MYMEIRIPGFQSWLYHFQVYDNDRVPTGRYLNDYLVFFFFSYINKSCTGKETASLDMDNDRVPNGRYLNDYLVFFFFPLHK